MKNISLLPKVFIDTNILLDYFIPSRERHQVVVNLFSLIFTHKIEATFSTQSLLDVVYIGQKHMDFPKGFRETLIYLLNRTNVYAIETFDFESALKNPNPDIEDSAQISFAYSHGCDILVTGDKKFLSREVPRPMRVMSPEDFVNACRA